MGFTVFRRPTGRVTLNQFCSSNPAYRGALWQRKPAQNEETVKRLLHGLCHRSCGFLHPAGRESAIVHLARAEHQKPAQRLRPLFASQHQYQPATLSHRHASIPMRRPAPTSFQFGVRQHQQNFV